MNGQASKWLLVYKLQHGLSSWEAFINAVETKFGSFDYTDAIGELIALEQSGSLDDYIAAFQDLRYIVSINNSGLGELYFTSQFVKGLKPELRHGMQCQVHESVKRAILLALVQQQVLDNSKFKQSRNSTFSEPSNPVSKPDTKSNVTKGAWRCNCYYRFNFISSIF